jgi:hypothetical protein
MWRAFQRAEILVLIISLLTLPLYAQLHVDRIIVHKNARTMELMSAGQVIKTYKIALGTGPTAALPSPTRKSKKSGSWWTTVRQWSSGLKLFWSGDLAFTDAVRKRQVLTCAIHSQIIPTSSYSFLMATMSPDSDNSFTKVS